MAGHLTTTRHTVVRWNAAIRRRAGRRGTTLAILALIDFGYGGGLATGYIPGFAHKDALFLPLVAWGWIWITIGIICLTGVLIVRDRFQFGCAALLKTAWAAIISVNWLTYHIEGGWTSVTAWGGIALLVLLISGWPEGHQG
jgi:hypothetical protein